MDIHEEFQRFKTHPYVRQMLEGGTRVNYGAKSLPAGGWWGECVSNCSFVSGEASTAFWLFAFVPLMPPRWRWPAGLAIALFAAAVSFGRIAFGRHFLSDTLIAGALSLTVIALVGWALQRRPMRRIAQGWAARVKGGLR